MEGGDEGVRVEQPKEVKRFRSIVNEIKRDMLSRLEQYNGDDSDDETIQDIGNLYEVVDRIKHLGNILRLILSAENTRQQAENLSQIDPVLELFEKYGFDFTSLDDHVRKLCLQYVDLDIFIMTYDLNPTHINSITNETK